MKILALQGSPRTQGNTQTVLDAVLKPARDAGEHVEVIHVVDLSDLTGCWECHACQEHADEPACVIEDDMDIVLKAAIAADLIVWATPVFCWSPAWPLKVVMDRFYCTFKFGRSGEIRSLLQDRKMAAVITAGGGECDGADLVSETFKRLADFSSTRWLGALVAANLGDPEATQADDSLTARATEFGRHLLAHPFVVSEA